MAIPKDLWLVGIHHKATLLPRCAISLRGMPWFVLKTTFRRATLSMNHANLGLLGLDYCGELGCTDNPPAPSIRYRARNPGLPGT